MEPKYELTLQFIANEGEAVQTLHSESDSMGAIDAEWAGKKRMLKVSGFHAYRIEYYVNGLLMKRVRQNERAIIAKRGQSRKVDHSVELLNSVLFDLSLN